MNKEKQLMSDLEKFQDADYRWLSTLPGKQIMFLEENEHPQTPADIIGYGNELRLIKKHLIEFDTPAIEKWTPADRKLVARLYEILRRHGWYNPQLDEHGRIVFGSCYKPVKK